MPTIGENLLRWGDDSSWYDRGDEWSHVWGGSAAQWHGCIYPRINAYLPAKTILEIAPGYGRWTQFLVPHCHRLVAVDLSPASIDACRKRFSEIRHTEFHLNDGRSLEMVADHSVDFVFSFDSLVHVERDVLGDYIDGISRKLTEQGTAFVHHSNLGEYRRQFEFFERIPGRINRLLTARRVIDYAHLRAPTVSASWFRARCQEAGLVCFGQELVNWGTSRLIDCFSLLARPNSGFARATEVIRNPSFMDEARSIRHWQQVHPIDKGELSVFR